MPRVTLLKKYLVQVLKNKGSASSRLLPSFDASGSVLNLEYCLFVVVQAKSFPTARTLAGNWLCLYRLTDGFAASLLPRVSLPLLEPFSRFSLSSGRAYRLSRGPFVPFVPSSIYGKVELLCGPRKRHRSLDGGCNGSREGDRGVESIFPWRLEGGKRIFLRIEEFLFLFDSSSSVRMNNSSLKNFEHVPLRVNFVGHRRISSVCIIDEDTCSISGRAIFAVLRCKKRREWREERGKGKEQNRENLMIVTIRFILSLKCFIRHFLCYVRINLIFLSRV